MKEKQLVRLPIAVRVFCACGTVMFVLGCSENWIAGDPPEVPHGAYLEETKNIKTPEVASDKGLQDDFPPLPLEGVGVPENEMPDESIPRVPDISYTVRKNDTLGSIALVYGVSAEDLAKHNGMSVKDVLPVGKKLLIPSAKINIEYAVPIDQVKKYTPPAPVDGPEKTASTAVPAALNGQTIHTVQAGDMLSKLAVRYHVSSDAIAKANGIKVNSVLRIGQKLVIPPPRKTGVKSTSAKTPGKTPVKTLGKASAKTPGKASAKPKAASKNSADADLDNMLDSSAEQRVKTSVPSARPETPSSASSDAPETYIYAVRNEISLDELAELMEYKPETLRSLNPGVTPSEKLQAGSRVVLPLLPE